MVRRTLISGLISIFVLRLQIGGVLDEVHAELLPEDKVKWIKEFQKNAPTAMIGDGLNDAPALSIADVGISMGISGSALASETGNVLLMTNDIQRIPKVAFLARRVRRKIFENIFLSIVTKAAIVALAIAGHPLVWAAVLADTGTCLLVILNSMLLLRGVSVQRKLSSSVTQTCSSKDCGTSCKSSKTSLDCKKLHETKHSCGHGGHDDTHHEHRHGHKHEHGQEHGDCGHNHKQGHYHEHKHKHGHHHEQEHDQEHGHCGHDHKQRRHHEHEHKHEHDDRDKKEINHATCSSDSFCKLTEEEKSIIEGKEMGEVVEHCCQSDETNTDHLHDVECGGKHDSDINVSFIGENKHGGGCRNRKCSNLDKRPIGSGGCCQSFMKECCAQNSHFGANFRGGLSEIVIE